MIRDIDSAILEAWLERQELAHVAWMGAFMRTEVLIAVRGCSIETPLFFEVGEGGRFLRVRIELELVAECIFQRV